MRISKQKSNGVVYTPQWVVDEILDRVGFAGNSILGKKIIDPSCGDGAFMVRVAKRLIDEAIREKLSTQEIESLLANTLFGCDIDKEAIQKCIDNLSSIAKTSGLGYINWNVIVADSLTKVAGVNYGFFDFVVGNPPYVRIQNLNKKARQNIQNNWTVCQSGSTDIYLAFFELGVRLLCDSGRLGYITPNSYLKTKAGEGLRSFILSNCGIDQLIDFGEFQVFDNATTYALITLLTKGKKNTSFNLFKYNGSITFVDTVDCANLTGPTWVLEDSKTLEKIKSIESAGKPLGKIAKISTGLATLSDDLYIFHNPAFNGEIATITMKDGTSYNIESGILKPIIKASTLKDSSHNQNLFIIFPYKTINGKNVIIKPGEMKKQYPHTYKYLKAIKSLLDKRDAGKPNPVCWYAFGRSQGLDACFGQKIITSPINLKPKFIVCKDPSFLFYAGYAIKYNGDLEKLASKLNSDEMAFYIKKTGKDFQSGYKSYSKGFIEKFGVDIDDTDLTPAKT